MAPPARSAAVYPHWLNMPARIPLKPIPAGTRIRSAVGADLLDQRHGTDTVADGPIRVIVFMQENKQVPRGQASSLFQITGNSGIQVALHSIAAATAQGDLDHHQALRAGNAIEAPIIKELIGLVVREQIEQLGLRHTDAVDQRLVDRLDRGLAMGLAGVPMNLGANERHVTFPPIEHSWKLRQAASLAPQAVWR